jgi:hypothetical protein
MARLPGGVTAGANAGRVKSEDISNELWQIRVGPVIDK